MSTARVLNPIILTEFCKLRSPAAMRRNIPNNRQIDKIKKDLFGVPNRIELRKYFEKELGKHHEISSQKWGFDFQHGCPLIGNGNNQQYIWERVPCNDFIPGVYALSRAAHVREAPSVADYDDDLANELLDQRAKKQDTSASTNSSFEDIIDQSDTVVFRAIIDEVIPCRSSSGKRQPKITEYMKERKRLAPTPKKLSPAAKRFRTTSSISRLSVQSTTASSAATLHPSGSHGNSAT